MPCILPPDHNTPAPAFNLDIRSTVFLFLCRTHHEYSQNLRQIRPTLAFLVLDFCKIVRGITLVAP